MRILFVNTFYYPNMQGGAEQSVKLLAEGLYKNGNQVAVYCADSKDGKNKVEEINGIRVYRCTTGKFNLFRYSYEKSKIGKLEKITQKLYTYYNSVAERDFIRVCGDFKPDVIHTNTLYGIPCTVWKAAKKKGIPVLHTIRDTAIISSVQYGHKINPIIEKFHRLYMRYYSAFAAGVTAPSEYTLSTSLAVGSFKNAVVKKCVFNSVELNPTELQAAVAEKKQRTSKHIKFMYAGRLVPIKGIEHMIAAFEKMKYQDCELFICGGGEMQPYVEMKAKENPKIVYCGKLNNKQLSDKYRECDVLIVPSDWPEPFGRVVIEGNKYGMPVIATRCGGIPEIIGTAKGGVLYQAGNVDELAEKMDYFTDRCVYNAYLDSIIKNLDIYSIDKQIAAFEKIYSRLCL